ncbi:MAG: TatD family hydrolase [Kiritimatiellales bacterium]
MKLFDAHCHLQDEALLLDIKNVMKRAESAGIARMACCGTSSKDWNEVLQLAAEYPQVIPMIGIHPWSVKGRDGSPSRPDGAARPAVEPYLWKEEFQSLEKLLREHPEAGIGETGLDWQERFTNRAEQEASFAAHLDLARALNRPVAVHCVQAWGRLIEILRGHPAPRVLLHAFGGAAELIPELVELNCRFSFCGSVTNPNAKRVRAVAVAVPEDRLLIETDSPDFTPSGCSPPNEPANLVTVARAVAELRGGSVEDLAALTFANAGHFFTSV